MAYSTESNKANPISGVSNLPTTALGQTNPEPDAGAGDFYELEVGEVVDVILTERHPDYSRLSDIGRVKCRLINSQEAQQKDQLLWYKCMDANIKQYPLLGEFVICAEYLGDSYYTQKLNVHNMPNHGAMFGVTQGGRVDSGDLEGPDYGGKKPKMYESTLAAGSSVMSMMKGTMGDLFTENGYINPLRPHEGHITFEGRFGQSIRFGNRARLATQKGYQSKAGKKPYKSPHILITTGHRLDMKKNGKSDSKFKKIGALYEENINDDASSIWLTTYEDVPLKISTAKADPKPFTSIKKPKKYDGKQVIINSDRIIFNSKVNEIMSFSKGHYYINVMKDFGLDVVKDIKVENKGNIIFKTEGKKGYRIESKTKVNIDGKDNINFGDKKGELLAKGETLQQTLEELIDAIIKSISPASAVAGPYPVTLTNPGHLLKVKAKLNKILSKRVTTI
jgi:hypothetical protein